MGTNQRIATLFLFLVVLLTGAPYAASGKAKPTASPADGLPTVTQKTTGLKRRSGLLDVWLDAAGGKLWLELPPPSGPRGEIGRYLYVEGLVSGLGSNPVGLDRGQLGPTRLVILRRVGAKVLVEQPNLGFRAVDAVAAETRAVDESFAASVLWAAPLAALDEDGGSLIDFTSFVVRDAHDVTARLQRRGQGSFELNAERSTLRPDDCLAFPRNLELEALLTWTGREPGALVQGVAPDPHSISLVQHHSLLALPEAGYRPRRFDPRAGSFHIEFRDYASPLDRPMIERWIVRHRLEKTDPGAAASPVREPIVYYLDPGVPEPVRGALLDGARWWAAAFEDAGFIDAFRVELLPDGAHPLDARYNVIQWVHRSTRGWSYGGGVVDPRTGEMIKGHVNLGSLRVRHDRLLFEGLAGTDATGSGDADDPVELSLARLRQLSAHEVGHTLGLAHNFAASTYGRASVMDYPAPLVRVDAEDKLDFSAAYAVGVGQWDRHAIRFAYSEFASGDDERVELEAIVSEGLERGLLFLSDADARPDGAAEPRANLWDNGSDPLAELQRVMAVRRIALSRFGVSNIASGRPLGLLSDVLAPLYLSHRYQVEATAKLIGGLEYSYAMRGDGQPPARAVDGARQREALTALLALLDPAVLDLRDELISLLLPRPSGYSSSDDSLRSDAAPAFDSLGVAGMAAALVIDGLLQQQRCARLIDGARRDDSLPTLEQVLQDLIATVFDAEPLPARRLEIRRTVREVLVAQLIGLAERADASPLVRSHAERSLSGLLELLENRQGTTAHEAELARRLQRWLERSWTADTPRAANPPPPGSPIGVVAGPAGCSHSRQLDDAGGL